MTSLLILGSLGITQSEGARRREPRRGSTAASSLLLAIALWGLPAGAHAQIYVGDGSESAVQKYDVVTGGSISGSLVTGVSQPFGIAVSGNDLFVSSNGGASGWSVGEYNATTGAAINRSFVAGLNGADAIAVAGNTLYVANYPGGQARVSTYNATTGAVINANFITTTGHFAYFDSFAFSGNSLFIAGQDPNTAAPIIGEYNSATGAAINASFITGIPSQYVGIAASGSSLFVPDPFGGTVALYSATTGALIKGNFTSGLASPTDLAVVGNVLFDLDASLLSVSKWDATTGAAINASFITGLDNPYSMAVAPIPESSAGGLGLAGVAAALLVGRRGKRSA